VKRRIFRPKSNELTGGEGKYFIMRSFMDKFFTK
jgi:hypothetical protein